VIPSNSRIYNISCARKKMHPLPILPCILILNLSLLIGGCSDTSKTPEAQTVPAPDSTQAPSLNPGEFTAIYEEGRITLHSNQAPLSQILDELASLAGTRLELSALNNGTTSIHLVQAPLVDAVSRLLNGQDFSLDFTYDQGASRTRLTMIRIGTTSPFVADTDLQPPPPPRLPVSDTPDALLPPPPLEAPWNTPETVSGDINEIAFAAESIAADQLMEQERLVDRLSFGSDEERAAAIESLVPRGDQLHELVAALNEDPDPAVRAAAAVRLGDGSGYAVTSALLDSLSDGSDEVVLNALLGLEMLGDKSVIDEIGERLAGNDDPTIQEALEQTSRRLEFVDRMDTDGIELEMTGTGQLPMEW
jgi:hypothetical protein